MATNRSERVRNRYGICLNDSCSKCKSKEVQEIPARKDFVCAECGKALRECPPPRSWWDKHGKKVIGAAVVAVLGAVGIGISQLDRVNEKDPTEPKVVTIDSVAQQKTDTVLTVTNESAPKPEVKTEPKKTQSGPKPGERYKGTLNLSYGKYVGDIVDGRPDGAGVLTYSQTQKVVSTKDVVAEPGERIEGVFEHGKASFVTLYKKDGNAVKVHR